MSSSPPNGTPATEASQAKSPAETGSGEFALGGQAVIEGVMMRSPHYFAVAVRRESGEVAVHQQEAVSIVKRRPYLNRPFVRGVFALFESLILGLKALNYSANVAMEDAEAKEAAAAEEEAKPARGTNWVRVAIVLAFLILLLKLAARRFPEVLGSTRLMEAGRAFWASRSHTILWIVAAVALFIIAERALDAYLRKRQRAQGVESAMPPGAMAVTIGLSLMLGVGLFVILPNAAADGMKRFTESSIALNFYEGVIRIAIFVAYVSLITLLPDIRRVFQFHGAEHKVVWTHEKKLALTAENARQFSTAHPRCGTSFVLFVLVLSIVVFAFFGWPSWPVRIASRLLLLPVIAGIGYEILKLSARKQGNYVSNLLIAPGLCLQKLTTREPDDDQVEVAIRAMEVVLQREGEHAARQQISASTAGPAPGTPAS